MNEADKKELADKVKIIIGNSFIEVAPENYTPLDSTALADRTAELMIEAMTPPSEGEFASPSEKAVIASRLDSLEENQKLTVDLALALKEKLKGKHVWKQV